jgi:hypothetical protein
VLLERGPTLQYDHPLDHYLGLSPPTIVMPGGGVIVGDVQWSTPSDGDYLPDGVLESRNWDHCDITKEPRPGERGRSNVQDATLAHLLASAKDDTVVIRDDGAYEVADLIAITPSDKLVQLVHCKWSSSAIPGCRLNDMQELLNQACRSHTWVRHPGFIEKLIRQLRERENSEVVHGVVDTLVDVGATYRRNEWSFAVVAVQPGLHLGQVQGPRGVRMRPSIASAAEWLLSADARLSIWGS